MKHSHLGAIYGAVASGTFLLKYATLVVLFCLAIFLSTPSFAVALPNDTVATDKLFIFLDKLHSFQADFTQVVLAKSKASAEVPTSGKIKIIRPGKFRWDTITPIKQVVIASGKRVWVVDEDLKQASKKKIDQGQAGNPAMLLTGTREALHKSFNVKIITQRGNKIKFKLYPKLNRNLYQWIELDFIGKELSKMVIANNLGQISKITFTNIDMNSPISPLEFLYTPGRDVDVIDETNNS